MSRIFITGSSDGLGLMAAQLLVKQGHSVVLHARNVQRAEAKHRRLPGAEAIVTGDLATLQQMRSVADEVNALGIFDAIIHNAAVGYREPRRVETEDGFAHVFAINSLAPSTAVSELLHRLTGFMERTAPAVR
jgi:NAD(P)-dependent dehydrogenase (short-subunit alcohol dehydrogenase family)